MDEELKKMVFKDQLSELVDGHRGLIAFEFCKEAGITLQGYYQKLRKNRFSKLEAATMNKLLAKKYVPAHLE